MRILLLIAFFMIAACSSFKEKAGLVKYKPDEYEVPTNPPLVVPPTFIAYSPDEAKLKKQEDEKTTSNQSLSKGENSILQSLK